MLGAKLNEGLKGLAGLTPPKTLSYSTHVFYVYALLVDPKILGVSRDLICKALIAEGVDVSNSYQNIHLLPIFQKKIAYGSQGFPWTSDICHRAVSYAKGICPVAEDLNDSRYLGLGLCIYDLDSSDIDLIIKAFHKVWAGIEDLKKSNLNIEK
jgi:dTDP-4-amino-4,6-dideoxygalactose transaminase